MFGLLYLLNHHRTIDISYYDLLADKMDNPNPATEKSEVWKKMAAGGLEDHPLIISTIESLLEKTHEIEDDSEREKMLKETFKKGVELLHREKLAGFNPKDLIDDDKIEDLILACLEARELDDSTEGEEFDEEEEEEEEDGDKSDHTYNKRPPSFASIPPIMLRKEIETKTKNLFPFPDPSSPDAKTLPLNIKTESLTMKSCEVRLDEIKQVISHNKVKKLMKPVSGSNPFVQRVSTATSTGLPKYIFTPRGGVQSVKKVNITQPLRDNAVNQTLKKRVDASTDTGADKIQVKPDLSNNVKPVPKNAPKPVAAPKPDPPNTIVIKHSQQWTVGNFSKKMRMGNGKSIDSMFFSVRVLGKKTDWSLMLYPNGDKERVAGYLSLYLTCRNRRALDMSLEFKFNLRDSEGETAASPSKSGSITAQMLATNSSWGWETFVKQEDLKRNGLLVNNKVTIICDITLKIQDPEAVKLPTKEEVLEDDRDIDALVNFVGELSTDGSKKKKKKNKSKKLLTEFDDQNNIFDSNPELKEDDPEIVDIVDLGSVSMSPESPPSPSVTEVTEAEETLTVDTDCDEFQVVSRRRRKNSQPGAQSPVQPPAEKSSKGKSKEKSKSKGANAGPDEKSSKEKTVKEKESKNHVKTDPKENLTKDPVKSSPVTDKDQSQLMFKLKPKSSLPAFCLDTKESLEELLKTKNLLEENIKRLTDLAAAKSEAIGQMNQDKVTKMHVMAQNQEQLRQQKISFVTQIEQQKKIIEDLEANVLEVDSQLKRCTEKEARMKMYLDMNIVDATSQLTQFGKEKDDLEARLDQVENKLRGNRRKERLLTIHNQILRLQTNLECPICAETASSPIYQCREVTDIQVFL